LISGITRLVENARGETLIEKSYKAIYYGVTEGVYLAYAPIKTITAVKVVELGTETALTSTDYYVEGLNSKAIRFDPAILQKTLIVEYTAGYTTVPSDLKAVIKSELQFMFKEKTQSGAFIDYLSKMKKVPQGTAPQLYSI
jgi:hypothetical protein